MPWHVAGEQLVVVTESRADLKMVGDAVGANVGVGVVLCGM